MNNDSGARQVIFELCLSENVKNKLTRFVHIIALSRFFLVQRSSLVSEQCREGERILLVVWVSPEAGIVVVAVAFHRPVE